MSSKGKAAGFSREAAVRAALTAIDESGLDAFNLNMVAQRMSIRAPSLYYHFKDKSEILAEVSRLLLLDADKEPIPTGGDWKERLIATSLAVRRSILRHPNAAPLLLSYPPRHLALGGYERTMRFMERQGVPAELHMRIVAGMDAISWGSILFEAVAAAQGFQLYPVYDPVMFPTLSRAKKLYPLEDEALFLQTMRTFLAGIELPESGDGDAPKAKKRRSVSRDAS